MNNPTTEQVNKRFEQLPKAVQDAIFAVETADTIGAISKKHQLSNKQISDLADEVGLVLLGFTRESEFVSHLTERLQISKEDADSISEEITKEIFADLKSTIKEEDDNENEAKTSEASSPSGDGTPDKPDQSAQQTDIGEKTENVPSDTETPPEQPKKEPPIPPKNLPREENTPHIKPQEEKTSSPAVQKEKTRPYSTDPYREMIE